MKLNKTFIIFINTLDYIRHINADPNLQENFSVNKKLIADTVSTLGYEFINLTSNFALTFKIKGENNYYQILSTETELSIKLVNGCKE